MNRHRITLQKAVLVSAIAAAFAFPVYLLAQEEEAEDTGVDTTLVPRPAVIAPRATSGLILSLAKAGSGYVAVGQRGGVLLSADGKVWKQVLTPADATLVRVRFLDDVHGWAVGYDGTILDTADGGKSWTLAQFDAAWGKPYFDILFLDASNGLVAGGNGMLKRTADGGKTWEAVGSRRCGCHLRPPINVSTIWMRSPIHRITGTAIELPIARYRGPSAANFSR